MHDGNESRLEQVNVLCLERIAIASGHNSVILSNAAKGHNTPYAGLSCLCLRGRAERNESTLIR